jgi:tetratricopeptide (TPR) repeat protein/TolB-like protein
MTWKLGASGGRRRRSSSEIAAKIRSIGALRFVSDLEGQHGERITRALLEDVNTSLSHLGIGVAATSSLLAIDPSLAGPAAADHLGVDAVLEGSIESTGGKLRVRAELVSRLSHSALWTGSYTTDENGLLEGERGLAGWMSGEIAALVEAARKKRTRRIRIRVAAGAVALLVLSAAVLGLLWWRSPENRKQRYFAAGKKSASQNNYRAAQIQFLNAVRVDPQWGEAQFELAQASARLNDLRRAYNALLATVRLQPDNGEAWLQLSQLSLAGHRYDDAREQVEHALKLKASEARANEILAYCDAAAGDLEAAEKGLESVLAQDPSMLRAAANLARLKVGQHDRAGAERVLKQVAERSPTANNLILLANFYLATGKTAEAEASYRQAIQTAPKNVSTQYALLRFLIVQDRMPEAEKLAREVADQHQDSPRERGAYARLKLLEGRLEESVAELRGVVQRHPDDRYNRVMLAEALARAGKVDDATAQLGELIKKNPKDVDALLVRASLAVATNKPDNAIKDVQQVLHFRPDSSLAHYYQGLARDLKHEPMPAAQELREALRRQPAYLAARLALARVYLRSKAAQPALQVLNETPAPQNRSVAVRVLRVAALNLSRQRDSAEKEARQLTADAPRFAAAHTQVGLLLAQRADYKGALAEFERALQLNKYDGQAVQALAAVYVAQKQAAAGQRILEKIVTEQPYFGAAVIALARLRVAEGQVEEAEKDVRKYLAAVPRNVPVLIYLSELLQNAGNLDGAERALRDAALADPNHPDVRFRLGGVLYLQKRPQQAAQQFREVLARDDSYAPAANNLAWLLVETGGNLDEALGWAQSAKEKEPDNPEVADTLGWVYCNKNNYSLALQQFQLAASRDPKNPLFQYHLAVAKIGSNSAEARIHLRAALGANQDFPGIEKAREMLRKLEGK